MSQNCSYPTCNNILPPEIPGEVPFKTCDRCQERDRLAKVKLRAEKKRKRAGSSENNAPQAAPNPPMNQINTGDALEGTDVTQKGYQDDSDESESGTEISHQYNMLRKSYMRWPEQHQSISE
jgi:hypothetical protein